MRTLLIVDDNVELANLLAVVADAHGFATLLAHTGQEAFGKIEGVRPDVALVDLLLPDIRGHELVRELSGRGVPCFAMSGVFCGEGLAREAMEVYGAKGFFEKPFAAKDLMERLAGLLPASEPLTGPDGGAVALEELRLDDDEDLPESEEEEIPPLDEMVTSAETTGIFATASPAAQLPPEPAQEAAPAPAHEDPQEELSLSVDDRVPGTLDGAAVASLHESLLAREVTGGLAKRSEAVEPADPENGGAPRSEGSPAALPADALRSGPAVPEPAAQAPEAPLGDQPAVEPPCPRPAAEESGAAAAAPARDEAPLDEKPADPPAPEALESPSATEKAPEVPATPAEASTSTASAGPEGKEPAKAPDAPAPVETPPSSEKAAAEPAPLAPGSAAQARADAPTPSADSGEPAATPAPRARSVERARARSVASPAGARRGGRAEGDEAATELPFSGRDVWRPAERLPTRAERAAASFKRTGSLADTSLPRLLTALYQGQQTGELRLRRNEVVKVIAVHDGRPVFAASNLSSERFARFAVRKGKLPADKLAFVQAEARRAGLRNGEAMVALGLLTEEERAELVVRQIKEIIWSAFDWTEGEYQFVLRASPRPDLIQVSISPGPLILEGIRTTYSLVRLRELVDASLRFFPTADPPYQLHELGLGNKEALLLAHADGSKSIEDLMVLSDLSEREALALLHGLTRVGILEARAQPPSLRSRIVLV